MSKTRTTVYIDKDIVSKFETYKLSLPKDDKITFSELVNRLLESHLNNPFNWQDQMLYAYAMKYERESEYE